MTPLDDRRPPFRFSYSTRVGFDETDAQGIVYYGRYMPYFDRARVEYLRNLGLLEHEPHDPELVMRALHVEYHAPARFDDLLDVFVRVARMGTSSMVWEFEADNAATGQHLVSARQTMVQVDLANRRPMPVDPGVRSAVERFEHELESA